jgi:hypothetical protein
MLSWHPGAAFVQDACNAYFYGLDDEGEAEERRPGSKTKQEYVDVLDLGRPAVAASNILSALCELNEVTLPWLGMAALQLREDGTRHMSPSQLAPFATAALMFGVEGQEMLKEVLPGALVEQIAVCSKEMP